MNARNLWETINKDEIKLTVKAFSKAYAEFLANYKEFNAKITECALRIVKST